LLAISRAATSSYDLCADSWYGPRCTIRTSCPTLSLPCNINSIPCFNKFVRGNFLDDKREEGRCGRHLTRAAVCYEAGKNPCTIFSQRLRNPNKNKERSRQSQNIHQLNQHPRRKRQHQIRQN